MGTFRTRVKKKGKRWIKGQSSTSNPTKKTYRNSATNNFFTDDLNVGPSALTVNSLQRHNNLTSSSWHQKEMLAVLAAVSEVIKENEGQENAVEYFAALITTLDGINLEDRNDDSVSAVLSLLSMYIKNIPKEILQAKFSIISKTLLKYLKYYEHSEHNIIVKSLLSCVATLLRLQDRAIWNDSSTFVIYDSVLIFIIHNKSKIRKAGQHAVQAILGGSEFCKEKDSMAHPAAAYTAKHCNDILKENQISEGGFTIVSHLLNLIKEIIVTFPKTELITCCNILLGLMKLKNPILTLLSLQTVHGLFSSKPKVACCPATLNAQIINAFYDYQPSFTDVQSSTTWLAAMQEAFSNLALNDLTLAMLNVPKFFKECTTALLSVKQEVIDNAAISLGAVLKDCVEPAASEENVQSHGDSIRKIYEILNHCLKYQYNAAWKQILYLLAKLYNVCGRTCQSFMMDCLRSLAKLRETSDFNHENEVDHVFGSAIRSMGPEVIINEFPVQVVEYQPEMYEVKRSWLLPLLRQYTRCSTLAAFFKNEFFFRRAVEYRMKSEALGKAGKKVGGHTYDLLQSQIWALLPSFCDEAQDIADNFKTCGQMMVKMLEKDDVSTLIMAAIRKLVNSCSENENDKRAMAQYSKHVVVALFNVYTHDSRSKLNNVDKAIRNAASETLKAYLTICDKPAYEAAYNMLLTKLKSDDTSKSDFKKESLLDLMRLLVPYQESNLLGSLFQNYISKVQDGNLKLKEEKQYYRLLEDMCACHSERCNEYIEQNFSEIKNLLVNTVDKASLPCRGSRIRTAKALLHYDSNDQVILEFLPEAVMCCKEGNKRCRASAFELVTHMAELMALNHGEIGVGKYLDALNQGLVGNTSMIAATILALTSTVHCYQDRVVKDHFDAILSNICLLAKCKTREIVGPTLGYLKLVITSKNMDHVIGNLELIIKTLSGIADDCKRKYRQKIRDLYDRLMRKYGAATIIPLVPTNDGVTLTRLKAIKKEQDRKMRKRQELKEATKKGSKSEETSVFSVKRKSQTIDDILAECDDDDDAPNEDESESETETRRRTNKKRNIYLTENEDSIIDFTSPAANKNITMGKPSMKSNKNDMKTKKEEFEFPVAPDGRLIITEKKPEPKSKEVNFDEESIADDAEAQENLSRILKNVRITRKRKMSENSAEEERPPARKYQAGGSGIHRKLDNKKVAPKKKVEKKNAVQPYDYIPLSRNLLNRRKKKKAGSGQFKKTFKKKRN